MCKEMIWKNVKQGNGFFSHQIKNRENGILFGGSVLNVGKLFFPKQNTTEKNFINTVAGAEL